MEIKKLSNEFMQKTAENEAWKDLSEDYPFTAEMLEKYSDKLDWEEISHNRKIHWTVPMLEKFKKKINWKQLSENADDDLLNPSTLEAFKDLWDWDELSENSNLPITDELLEQYADRWNWSKLIDNYWDFYDGKGITFYEKYKEHIPEAKLQNTRLWRDVVAQTKKQMIEDIIVKG